MTPARLKSGILNATLVSAFLGALIIFYVVYAVLGYSEDGFSLAFHPFVAFYGGYLIYLAIMLRKEFRARFIHEYLSAVFIPAAFIPMIIVLGQNKTTTWLRASCAVLIFLVVGVVYKVTLARVGKKLFGEAIKE